MSARGSTAKISSLSSMSPPALASRVCTLTFILAFLAFVSVGSRLDAVLGCAGLLIFCGLGGVGGFSFSRLGGLSLGGCSGLLLGGDRSDFLVARPRRDLVGRGFKHQARLGQLDLFFLERFKDARRIRSGIRARQLDRVADGQPAALVAWDRALDEQQAADRIGTDDLEVLLGAIARAHVSRHFLVLEHAAGILAVAGGTVRSVRDGHAVGRAETAEAPALHRSGEALALGHAGNIDQLAWNEVIGADVRADVEQSIVGDAELDDPYFRLDLGLAEGDALRLGNVLRLRLASAKLHGGIAVAVRFTAADDLHVVQLQDGNRHGPTVRLEQAGPSDLLRDHAGAHDPNSSNRGTRPFPGACSPSKYLRAPPGLVPRIEYGTAGTQPGASLRRYHPISRSSRCATSCYASLISTSTPAARSSFISASPVCGVGCTISSSRL